MNCWLQQFTQAPIQSLPFYEIRAPIRFTLNQSYSPTLEIQIRRRLLNLVESQLGKVLDRERHAVHFPAGGDFGGVSID